MKNQNIDLTVYLLRRVRDSLLLLGLWPCLAWATGNHLAEDLEAIPTVAYLVTFLSSFLGGLAGTMHRMSKHLEPGAEGIKHPKIFVAANLLGGGAAGWFSFLVGTQAGTPTLLVQGIVLLSAFGGAAIVEQFVDKWLPPRARKE